MNNNLKNMYNLYKDRSEGLRDLYELMINEEDPLEKGLTLKCLKEELTEFHLSEIISKAVKFEKTMPANISDWQRISTIYNFIKKRELQC